MAHAGAAAAATAGGTALGAFGYNRGNYMYDAEFRWERFTSAREYANQQSEQYRGDIRNLAALTVKKNTLWATTSTLCMALCVALYCAGRLGLHGPSPPAWIMGLWLTNNAASFAFMALTTFLALHASFRANAASVHLLTRKTRVPVPTLKQLDEARRFASEFEQQGVSDILRIPYLSNNGAPRTDEACYEEEANEGPDAEGHGRRGRRSTSAPPGGRNKCSSWVREEFEGDRSGSVPASDLPEDAAPEHFRLYAAVQKEFYEYDIYARVGIFLGFIHYFQSLCFYGLGHINIELRAFWVAYGCTFVLAVLMALVLRFDIIPQSGRKQLLPKCEYFGPLAVLPAAIGMSLDFRVEYDPTAIALTWVFIFVAYIFQLIYALRILEIVLPDEKFEGLGERLGAAWLPEGWNKVPSSFYHVLYAVAPPTKLQPGQHDIVREVKEGGRGASAEVLGGKDMSASEAAPGGHTVLPQPAFSNNQVHPWKLMAAICAVMPCSWCFLILGNIVDVAIGEQGLVTAPHWSRPPMSRQSLAPHELGTPIGFPWASGAKPFIPEQMAWHEEKRHADEYSIGRRLSTTASATAGELNDTVRELLELMSGSGNGVRSESRQVSWPSFFEPRLLACGAGGHVAAITARGFGAAAPPTGGAAEAFSLSGLTSAGPLVSASWDAGHEGLLLASKRGGLFSCLGGRPAAGGVWACAPASSHGFPSALPLAEGAMLRAAATSVLKGALHAAMILEEEPELVALFVQEAGSWMPLGELRVPTGSSKGTSLSFMADGDLLISTGAGRVRRHSLLDGATVASAVHQHDYNGETAWQAACGFGDDRMAHLSLQKDSLGWQPTLTTVEMLEAKAKAAVFE